MSLTEQDVVLADGRTLHVYDSTPDGPTALTVYWHHGSPNVGAPPAPLVELSAELGVRWISHTRPGYAESTRVPDRDVASVAADVAEVATVLGVERFATMGHSGGGAHALATAAMLPDRVVAAAIVSGMAPLDADGRDGLSWWEGLGPAGAAELRAAAAGREALESYLATADDEPQFTPGDEDALMGDWNWFLSVVRPAVEGGMDGFVDDDLAGTHPWGFDPATIAVPTLVVHGDADAVVPPGHGRWVAGQVPGAELWSKPGDGHISIMRSTPDVLRWLVARA